MHELIPTKFKISIVVAVILILLVLFSVVYKVTTGSANLFSPDAFLKGFSWIVTILGVFSFALGFEKPWAIVARPALLRLFGIPPMLGQWQGTIESNYSRLEALRNCARNQDRPPCDADSPDFQDNHPLLARGASLQVVGSLWRIKVILTTGPAADSHKGLRSESVVSRALRTEDGSIEVWYVYRAVNHHEPAGNDTEKHLGAAILSFTLNGCSGVYWTERNWRKGMNTAGRMAFSLTLHS
jgi:hypothetical protein